MKIRTAVIKVRFSYIVTSFFEFIDPKLKFSKETIKLMSPSQKGPSRASTWLIYKFFFKNEK